MLLTQAGFESKRSLRQGRSSRVPLELIQCLMTKLEVGAAATDSAAP